MNLREAKEVLKNAGYLIEDTETSDIEMDDLARQVDNIKNPKAFWNKQAKIYQQRMNLDDKIKHARRFNHPHLADIEADEQWLNRPARYAEEFLDSVFTDKELNYVNVVKVIMNNKTYIKFDLYPDDSNKYIFNIKEFKDKCKQVIDYAKEAGYLKGFVYYNSGKGSDKEMYVLYGPMKGLA